MKRRTVLWWSGFLIAILLFLGLRQWRLSQREVPASPTPTPNPNLLPPTFADKVQRLEIYQGEVLLLTLERDAQGQWSATAEGIGDVPLPEGFQQMVDFLLLTRALAVLPPNTDPATVGLAQPQWRIRVISGDTFYNLDIGGPTPVGDGYYVRRTPRGEIFVVPSIVVQALMEVATPGLEGTPTPFSAPTPSPGG